MKKNLPILIFVLVVILLVAGLLTYRGFSSTGNFSFPPAVNPEESSGNLPSFEPFEANPAAPAELSDEAVAELDAVFAEVESSDESLSGLGWEE